MVRGMSAKMFGLSSKCEARKSRIGGEIPGSTLNPNMTLLLGFKHHWRRPPNRTSVVEFKPPPPAVPNPR